MESIDLSRRGFLKGLIAGMLSIICLIFNNIS